MTFSFDGQGDFPTTKSWTSRLVWKNNVDLVSATLRASENVVEGDVIRYFLIACSFDVDDNVVSETEIEVENGVSVVLPSGTQGLKFMVVKIGYSDDTYADYIEIEPVEAV